MIHYHLVTPLTKKSILILPALILLSIFACKKNKNQPIPDPIPEKSAPKAFNVSVTSRESNWAEISWTIAVGESVSYDVELEGKVIASNLNGIFEWEIKDLDPSKKYTGKVIAHDKNGKQTAALFDITLLDQQIYMTNYISYNWAHTAFDGSGKIYWTTTGAELLCIPAVSGDTLFIGGKSRAMALNRTTGNVIWNRTAAIVQNLALLCYKGKLVLPGIDRLDILNSATGTVIWTLNLPDYTEPFINKGTLYTSASNLVFAYDLATGTKKWQFTAGDKAATPLVLDGTLYFIGADGNFYALNSVNGSLKWKSSFSGTTSVSSHLSSRPTLIGNNIYFSSCDYAYNYDKQFTVRALNKNSGASVWSKFMGTNQTISLAPHPQLGLFVSAGSLWLLDPATGTVKNGYVSSENRITVVDRQVFYTYYLSKTVLGLFTINKTGPYGNYFVMPNGDGWWQVPVVVKNGKAYYPSECAMNWIE